MPRIRVNRKYSSSTSTPAVVTSSAARAIESAIHLRYPDRYDITLVNVSNASGSQRVRMMYESYNLLLKADPRYAKHGLKLLNSFNVEKAMIPWFRRAYQNMRRVLEREQPDLIVSVHAIINHAMISALTDLGWNRRVPYIIVCTDLTDNFLKGWANPDATLAITFTETARRQLVHYGMPPERIQVHQGFAVNPAFFTPNVSQATCRETLGLHPQTFTILVSIGGVAIPRKTSAIVRTLVQSGLPIQLLVVCGANRSLKRRMHYVARSTPIRMHVHGFTQRIAEMMTAADVMITKPGPGSIMEAVVKELPLILDAVTEPMPQEKGNLDFAVQNGIAIKLTNYRHLPQIIERLITDQQEYQQLKSNMHAIKREQAIFDVAETILAQLEEPAEV